MTFGVFKNPEGLLMRNETFEVFEDLKGYRRSCFSESRSFQKQKIQLQEKQDMVEDAFGFFYVSL